MWSSDGRPHMGHGITNLQIHTGQYLPPFLSSPFTFETREVCCLVGIMYVQLSLSLSPLLSSFLLLCMWRSIQNPPSQNHKKHPPTHFSVTPNRPHHPPKTLFLVYIITSQFLSILTSYESLRCKPNLSSFSSGLFSPLHPSTRVCILWLPYVYNYGKLPSFSSFSGRLSHIKSKGICVMSLVRRVFFFLCVSTRRAS